jgi:hypothetical protein
VSALGRETIERVREAPRDEFGDPTDDIPQDLRYTGCAVYPRGSDEDAGRSATTVTGYTCLCPDVDADINEGDKVRWRGDLYAVQGKPGKWYHLDASPAGLQIALSMGED